MLLPKFEFDQAKLGNRIVGVDEVGRGSWAGPFVLSGFSFSIDTLLAVSRVGHLRKEFKALRDSKKLSLKLRIQLGAYLSLLVQQKKAQHVLIVRSADYISNHGLAKAARSALDEIAEWSAFEFAGQTTSFFLDGGLKLAANFPQQTIIKGDDKFYSIAAAAILAKVYRDSEMQRMALNHPGYGFESNVGYGTPGHRKALKLLGPSPVHRLSYKPIKALLRPRA